MTHLKSGSLQELSPSNRSVRIKNFLSEMFPFFPAQAATFGSFAVNALILTLLLPNAKVPSGTQLLCGALTVVLWNLQLRCFDEIKDYPTDVIHFPDRPLVTGALLHSDLKFLIGVLQVFFLVLQIPFLEHPLVLLCFGVTQLYSWASFRWFFAESKIRPNLIFAFLTHHPLVFLFQAYLLCTFLASPSSIDFSELFTPVSYLVGVGMIGTAWEIARKMRGTLEETAYRTYTQIFGVPRATSVFLLILLGSTTLWVGAILSHFKSQTPLIWVAVTLPLLQLVRLFSMSFRFIKSSSQAPLFKAQVEIFALVILISLLVFFFSLRLFPIGTP